ncbi:hypothetical protein LNAOJCKE_0378 [Methylorubrum aminovorans]|uniref:Uncharacterized protein n=1 Tax=Methylorubrum aminovorans TaxID=269069 RepID=A0ABQ4U886_9HYPH|nr:hypothetical protein [Methylorubrum aminovorans]GJE63184.1 hypothetical protein LNAOJCKE_0378 [Methylorubrum aminovorans]GMA79228.1 hypothetical protein GCM10025880_56450 [Methylorubrum aminovorans]
MSEPYTHTRWLVHSIRCVPPNDIEKLRSVPFTDADPAFFAWMSEHIPSASFNEVVRSGGRKGDVGTINFNIEVTIPDPDEAVAYRLRWT